MILNNGHVGGSSGIDTGDIGHSLRFRGSNTARLTRTFGTPTSALLWKAGGFFKYGTLSAGKVFISAGTTSTNYQMVWWDSADGKIKYLHNSGGTNVGAGSTDSVFRDPSGHYFTEFEFDSANANAADRFRVLVNGVRQPFTFTTAISLNRTTIINGAIQHYVGERGYSTIPTDMYVSRFFLIDGAVPASSSFIYFNTEINEWVSKTVSQINAAVVAAGGWGNNGDLWDFDDGTSLTTLGQGKFNGKNWTLNNFSLTAGVTYDWMLDVPGNSYATLNPLDQSLGSISDGNLKFAGVTATFPAIRAGFSFSSGKWVFQWLITAVSGTNSSVCGIAQANAPVTSLGTAPTLEVGYISTNGNKRINGNAGAAYGATYTTNDVIRCEVDLDALQVEFVKNGVSQGLITGITAGTYSPYCYDNTTSGANTIAFNFGQQPWFGGETPNAGFQALCQRNLPTPAILNPRKYFDVVALVGDGTGGRTYPLSLLFDPDFVEMKNRSVADGWQWYDRVRGFGSGKELSSNNAFAEGGNNSATSGYLASVSASELITAAGSTNNILWNENLRAMVVYLAKAGGVPVTNTDGSTTSQVSANVEAGFSIVLFDAVASAVRTVGHGLDAPPELVIAKSLVSGTLDWYAFHSGLTSAAYYVRPNSTAAQASNSAVWSSTAPDSSVFTQGSGAWVNGACIAFCARSVPGYSKVTKATLIASADNTYIDFGFKPAMIWAKQVNSTSNWYVWDKMRSPDNPMDDLLYLNLPNAEAAGLAIDATAIGCKVRTSAAGEYIFYAIADVAGKFSLAR